MKKKIVRAKKMKSPKRIESVPHRLGGLRAPTNRTGSAGSDRGPATTEIDSPHLRGGGRLTGEPGRYCLRNIPPASTGGNSVGTDVRIWWETGNRTGFPQRQDRVPAGCTRLDGLRRVFEPVFAPPRAISIRSDSRTMLTQHLALRDSNSDGILVHSPSWGLKRAVDRVSRIETLTRHSARKETCTPDRSRSSLIRSVRLKEMAMADASGGEQVTPT